MNVKIVLIAKYGEDVQLMIHVINLLLYMRLLQQSHFKRCKICGMILLNRPVSTKKNHAKKEVIKNDLFYTAQVTPLGGVTVGADICADHFKSPVMMSTTPFLDSDVGSSAESYKLAFPVDIQIIIANGMTPKKTKEFVEKTTSEKYEMPNMKIQNKGYVIRCDGQFLKGGQIFQATNKETELTLTELGQKLHMDTTSKRYDSRLNQYNGGDIITVRDQIWTDDTIMKSSLFALFTNEITWALVSDKLVLDLDELVSPKLTNLVG